ncbi:MAG: F0F1 ATP synthase subunit B [Thermoanaerobaculia bacterium]
MNTSGRNIANGPRVARVTALLAFAATAARASEEAAGGPFEGNIGVALWTLVIFALVIFVLGKYAWGPILGGLQEREKFIRTSLESAKADRDAAEARLKEYTDKLVTARAEATAIVDEARRDADVVKSRIQDEAHAEATRMIERAKREIGIAKETAIKDLYSLTARLTTDVASKILGREVQPQDHDRLIRESIAQLTADHEA